MQPLLLLKSFEDRLLLGVALRHNQVDGLFLRDFEWVDVFRDRHELLVVHHVRAEASRRHHDVLALKRAANARQFEEVEGFFERDGLDALPCGKACEARFFLLARFADLRHWPEAANLHHHGLAAGGIGAEAAFAHLVGRLLLERAFHVRLEIFIERLNEFLPILLAFCHLVKLFLDVGGEVVVHNAREGLHEEVVDHEPHVGRHQFAFLAAHRLGARSLLHFAAGEDEHREGALRAFLVALGHIAALLDGRNSGRVGRRAADAQFLEFMHERGFVVTCRCGRETLAG